MISRKAATVETLRISTRLPNLNLIQLTVDDALDYYRLVARNRGHLTRHGDYEDLGRATLAAVSSAFSDPADRNLKFGIWLGNDLIGRVDLSQRVAGHFGSVRNISATGM